jgi:hypothetical protein
MEKQEDQEDLGLWLQVDNTRKMPLS